MKTYLTSGETKFYKMREISIKYTPLQNIKGNHVIQRIIS